MQETLKMMKSILIGGEDKSNENELIGLYKENKFPNILAYFFVKNYSLLQNVCSMYNLLTDEDKASFCLQELDKCLCNFDSNKNIKFTTFFIKYVRNRLNSENLTLIYNMHKIMNNISSLEDNQDSISNELDIENLNILLEEYKLTNIEKIQCNLINQGYKLYEIANMFGISKQTVSARNKKIKQKILDYTLNLS